MTDLAELSRINRSRCDRWHSAGEPWISSDWSNALAGETGELCNQIKKYRRHETGAKKAYNTPPVEEVMAAIRDEIADVFLYLDLVAYYFGMDLQSCISRKFNLVSEAQGFPERITP